MSESPYPAMVIRRKSGLESFHASGTLLPFDLMSFWQWSASDLVCNALRGVLAEFLVAQALSVADGIRVEWASHDICTQDGVKVEVKSAAYLQSWAQKALSPISFDIAPKQLWTESESTDTTEAVRCADVYVFALLAHKEKSTLDPMNVAQWEFFILARSVLDIRVTKQKQIALSSLRKLNPIVCTFDDLGAAIRRCFMGTG